MLNSKRRKAQRRRTGFEACEPRLLLTTGSSYTTALSAIMSRIQSAAAMEGTMAPAAAVKAAVINDPEGHSPATALKLGPLGLQKDASGSINFQGDVDYFQFKAPRSGVVTATLTPGAGLLAQFQAYYAGSTRRVRSGDTATMSVEAGKTYTVQLGGIQGTGNYQLDFILTPYAQNLGTTDAKQLGGQKVKGERWYCFTTLDAGDLSVQSAIAKNSKNISLQLYTANFQVLATAANQNQTLSTDADAGQTYFLRVAGSNSTYSLQVTNDPLPVPPAPDPSAVPLPQWVYDALANPAITTITMPQGRFTLPAPLQVDRSNVTLDFTGCTLVLTPDSTNNSFNAITVGSTINAFSVQRTPSHLIGQITAGTTQLTMDPQEIVDVQPGEVVEIQAGVDTNDPGEVNNIFLATVQAVDLQTGVITFTAPLGVNVPVYSDVSDLESHVDPSAWYKIQNGTWGTFYNSSGGTTAPFENYSKGLGLDQGLVRFDSGITSNVTILNPTFEITVPTTAANLPNGSSIIAVWDASNVTVKNVTSTGLVGSLIFTVRAFNLSVDGVTVRGSGVAKVWNGPTTDAYVFASWGVNGATYRNIDVQGTNMVLTNFEVTEQDVVFDGIHYNVNFDDTPTYAAPGNILGFFGNMTGALDVNNASFMATGDQQRFVFVSGSPTFENLTIPAANSPFYLNFQNYALSGTTTINNTNYGPLTTDDQVIDLSAPAGSNSSYLQLPQGLYQSIQIKVLTPGSLTNISDGAGDQYTAALSNLGTWIAPGSSHFHEIQAGAGIGGYADYLADKSLAFQWAGSTDAQIEIQIAYYPLV